MDYQYLLLKSLMSLALDGIDPKSGVPDLELPRVSKKVQDIVDG
jgi:hypothetical protein